MDLVISFYSSIVHFLRALLLIVLNKAWTVKRKVDSLVEYPD